ncbi:MAG TPA: hypothetical protein ENL09_03320 [Bacteroidetes bacterium]|nr:hypothetical protein [Bacteroidota bacterium]
MFGYSVLCALALNPYNKTNKTKEAIDFIVGFALLFLVEKVFISERFDYRQKPSSQKLSIKSVKDPYQNVLIYFE